MEKMTPTAASVYRNIKGLFEPEIARYTEAARQAQRTEAYEALSAAANEADVRGLPGLVSDLVDGHEVAEVSFRASDRDVAARIIWRVFGSAPDPDNGHLWDSQRSLRHWAEAVYDAVNGDGDMHGPSATMPDEAGEALGCAELTTNGGRVITRHFDPAGDTWSVDFTYLATGTTPAEDRWRGSTHAAALLAASIAAEGKSGGIRAVRHTLVGRTD